MTMQPQGRVNVPVSGTPTPLSADPTARCAHLQIQVIPGLTGKIFVGSPTMNTAALAGVVRILWPNPSGGISDSWEMESHADEDNLWLNQYAIDAGVSGEGALITWWAE